MPLSRSDCRELLQYLHASLREADPGGFQLLAASFEGSEDPRRALLSYLDDLIKSQSERSSGSYPWVLDALNRYVRTEDGGPVQALRVVLSPEEVELYGTREFDLAELPDRSEFVDQLRRLRSDLLESIEFERGNR